MSDRTSQQTPTLAQLRAECHRLLEVVARRPGAAKLLLAVHKQLLLFSQYKANCCSRFYPRDKARTLSQSMFPRLKCTHYSPEIMLKTEIENQKKAIAEFETALQALELAPQFHPSSNAPLDLLKAVLAAETDEQGRAKRKEQAESVLDDARTHLSKLELQWDALTQRAKDGAGKLKRTSDRVNKLSEQLEEALKEWHQTANEYETTWIEANGQSLIAPSALGTTQPLPRIEEADGRFQLTVAQALARV